MEQKVLKPSERIGEIRDKIIQDMVSAYKKKVAAEAASLETDNPSILGCKTFFSPASCRSNSSLFDMDTCTKTVEFCEKPEVWIQAILDYLDDLPGSGSVSNGGPRDLDIHLQRRRNYERS